MIYVVDTHAIVWYLEQSDQLGRKAFAALDDLKAKLVFPSIVLAEIKYLSHKQRINLQLEEILSTVEQDERCLVFPLDMSVIKLIPIELNIHDGIICGTALVYQKILKEKVALITKDKEIVESGLVETIWN